MARVSAVVVQLLLVHSALAFVPLAAPSKVARRAAAHVPLNTAPMIHREYKCDCCGMDPIVGPRFECANVEGIDICSVCAVLPGQSFSAGGKTFGEMQWLVHSGPSTPGARASSSSSVGQPNEMYAHESLPPPKRAKRAKAEKTKRAKAEKTYSITDSGPSTNPDGTYKYDRAGGSRYSSYAPDANKYDDDKEFRAALRDNMEKAMQERRAAGNYGNQATSDYMSSL